MAAKPDGTAASTRELRSCGAIAIDERRSASGRVLVDVHFPDELAARRAVVELRSRGYAAVARPEGDGHLAAWRANTAPLIIADRLQLRFPWTDTDVDDVDVDDARVVVEIDPGAAFGAGRHPSTRLLLGELARRMHGGEKVLDVGCGSGVLAIAAARLGASRVIAVDVRDEAVAATRANARRNRVGATVEASVTPVGALAETFDVILANIGAKTLAELAPTLAPRLASDAWLGLSGLSPAQVSVVAAAYPGTCVDAVPADGDWVAVVLYPSAASSVSTEGAK